MIHRCRDAEGRIKLLAKQLVAERRTLAIFDVSEGSRVALSFPPIETGGVQQDFDARMAIFPRNLTTHIYDFHLRFCLPIFRSALSSLRNDILTLDKNLVVPKPDHRPRDAAATCRVLSEIELY